MKFHKILLLQASFQQNPKTPIAVIKLIFKYLHFKQELISALRH